MHFAHVYPFFCDFIFVLSLLLNGILAYAASKRTQRIGGYRYFTFAFTMVDVLYATVAEILAPFFIVSPGILAFFPLSRFWMHDFLIAIAFNLWWSSYAAIVVLIALSFVYRYGLLCSKQVLDFFHKPSNVPKITVFSLIFILLWAIACVEFIFNYSPGLREKMIRELSTEFDIDFRKVQFSGADFSTCNIYLSLAGLAYIFVALSFVIGVMVYCGVAIHVTILSNAISPKAKSLHSRALKMLIAQALNPTIFLFAPPFLNGLGMFVDFGTKTLPMVLAPALSLFPVLNPLIVILFTDDYRHYVLCQVVTKNAHISSIVGVTGNDTSQNG